MNKKRMLRGIKRITIFLLLFWLVISFFDFGIANSYWGGSQLVKYNIVVTVYKVLDFILKGYIF